MNDIASLLAATGVGSVVTALVAGLFGWRLRSANYAQIVSDMAREVAEDLREDNAKLEHRVERLEHRVLDLTEALREAIHRLDDVGHDTDPLRAVLHGRTNGTGR
ncbi:hypothetical protein IU469_22320 [Nocardia puris]|uniref:hypothetical protein n=1 Tax=Nocardia puris TaxID=208602 RepID=UPI001895EB0E|nr:hypothetical protein [Nocardia puris]MBF6368436.1 hypothetical protein [Nocardia puris]